MHPDAEPEVIEAAYRQLMKKYHPDVAGADPRSIAEHHRRAKEINAAYRVLRDPEERRRYDLMRIVVGTRPAPPPGPRRDWSPPPPPPPSPVPPRADFDDIPNSPPPAIRGPLALLSTAYYMLPGPYEWEKGRHKELLVAGLVPAIGITAFALATGRLSPLIGRSLGATALMWGVLLLVSVPAWHALPRVVLAVAPSLVMLTPTAVTLLSESRVPPLLGWVLSCIFSLVLSARLFVFSVLPTLAACWLLTRFT